MSGRIITFTTAIIHRVILTLSPLHYDTCYFHRFIRRPVSPLFSTEAIFNVIIDIFRGGEEQHQLINNSHTGHKPLLSQAKLKGTNPCFNKLNLNTRPPRRTWHTGNPQDPHDERGTGNPQDSHDERGTSNTTNSKSYGLTH